MAEWPVRELGDLCTRVTVGHVGSMASRYVSEGIPFLRSQNVKRGRLDLAGLKYIDDNFHRELAKSQLNAGDLVIVRTGEPGVAAVVPDGIGPLNCSDLVIARPAPGVDVRFMCYAINETAEEFVRAHTVGAVQQHFNVASAKKLALKVPSLPEQQAIAAASGRWMTRSRPMSILRPLPTLSGRPAIWVRMQRLPASFAKRRFPMRQNSSMGVRSLKMQPVRDAWLSGLLSLILARGSPRSTTTLRFLRSTSPALAMFFSLGRDPSPWRDGSALKRL